MLRLAFLLLLLTSQPVLAANLWEKDCDEDMVWAVEINLINLGVAFERSGKFDIRLPRKIGLENALCIDELIAVAEQNDWGRYKKFHQKFVEELKWLKDLLVGDMGVVYRLARIYKDRDDGILDKTLSMFFLQWAADKKYPPAEFDVIQKNFLRFTPPHTGLRLMNLADQGYVPAMLDAARRFLNGDALEKNLGDAYYWIKRAEAAHGDLSGIIEKPYERLLEQMTDYEKGSLIFYIITYGKFE